MGTKYRFLLLLGGMLSMGDLAIHPMRGGEPWKYPTTKTVDQIDDYHGTKVKDPYRWLEDDVRTSVEVRQWVDAQAKLTGDYLASLPYRKAILQRLTDIWNYEKFSAPRKVGGRYFFSKNDGLQNQSVLYVQNDLSSEPKVLLDPNQWSKDGTIALGGISFSDDGKLLAYSVSEAGSDWQTWHVMDIDSKKVMEDVIHWVKFSSAVWTKDNKGFFYCRYDEPKKGETFKQLNFNQKLMYHLLGTDQKNDAVIYQRPDHPEWGFSPEVSEDGHYLVFATWKGTDRRGRVSYKDLTQKDSKVVELIDHFENKYNFIDNDGPIFYFETDLKAANGRIIAIDIRNPIPEKYQEIIPEQKEKLESISFVHDQLICTYLKDARSLIKIYSKTGKSIRELELPGIGSAGGFAGKRSDSETFYTFSSFATPPRIYQLDLQTGKSSQFRESKVKFDPNLYEVTQVFYQSKDGTKVPMFIVGKKGIKKDGKNPTILYGYGGFNISLTPAFSPAIVSWLELGGIYAVPNLRGGGEYGNDWHKAGTKLHKQNVFDDFIAAAEYLIAQGYTSTPHLAIRGGSNGGLLVGACMTQRPDLYGACLPHVGVMDMLRFQRFTAGRFWVDDYGNAEKDPSEFRALYAYSPYHNIKSESKYPPTLVFTADTDDRVVPGHSFKFLAALQSAQKGNAPVLGRIETKAGHGAGKPTAKLLEEYADEWAFLVANLKMTLPKSLSNH